MFAKLSDEGHGLDSLAAMTRVSRRTVFDWRRGKYLIPEEAYKTLLGLLSTDGQEFEIRFIDERVQKAMAGRLGGASFMGRYGSLGNQATRQLGGQNSYAKHKDSLNGIFAKKLITLPSPSEELAEFFGIMIGDGTIAKYQIGIALNLTDDREYANFVTELLSKLFATEPSLQLRPKSNCIVITTSSIVLVEYLTGLGLPKGDKLRAGLDVPTWILEDRRFIIACLRGMFDTDGCVFWENHVIKGKTYSYPRVSFVSASLPLRTSIYEMLTQLELCPKMRNNRSVNLEKAEDINSYFRIVGTSNPKHTTRFMEGSHSGRVHLS